MPATPDAGRALEPMPGARPHGAKYPGTASPPARRRAPRRPRSRSSSRCAGGPAARSAGPPSNGRPDACARRCRNVAPGGPGRLVEIDEALLGGDEHRDRGRELRDRRPLEAVPVVAVRSPRPPGDDGGRVLALPPVDLPQGLHERRDYRGGPPPHLLGRRVRGARRLLARRARRRPRVGLRDGADHARRRRPACRRLRAGAGLPRRSSRARSSRRARRSTTSCARASTSPTRALIEDVGRAHGEAFASARPAMTGVVDELLDPRWLVEIEAEAVILPACSRSSRRRSPARARGRARAGERARPLLRQGRPVHARCRGGVHAARPRDVGPRPAHRLGTGRGLRQRAPRAHHRRADAVGARGDDAGLPDGRRRAACARELREYVGEIARTEGCRFGAPARTRSASSSGSASRPATAIDSSSTSCSTSHAAS